MNAAQSFTYLGSNLPDLNVMLTGLFGPSKGGAWTLTKVMAGCGRIETKAGDIYFRAGDTVWVKGTSILVAPL